MMKWACAGLVGILSGCGQGELGGGGIEIPNGLNVTVKASDETALSGVKVRLFARDSWTVRTQAGLPTALDSTTTDADGHARFQLHSTEGFWVEAVSGRLGRRAQTDGPGQIPLTLSPLSTLSGQVTQGPNSGVRIRLGGSDRTTVTDAAGAFTFDSIPQGTWNIVAQPGRALAPLTTVTLGLAPISVQGLTDDTTTVVLDDFSNATDVWNLHGLFGSGYWWIAANTATPKSVFGVDGAWQSVAGDSTRHWISFSVNATSMATNPWVIVGMDLGSAGGFLPELSGLNAVRIQCRGTGTWTFSLTEVVADSVRSWTAPLPLNAVWSTVHLSASTLVGPSGLTWRGGPRRVRQIHFQTTGSGSLDIREVALEGASLSDWSK